MTSVDGAAAVPGAPTGSGTDRGAGTGPRTGPEPGPDAGSAPDARPGRRRGRRAVRPGAGDPDPSVDPRSADDGDVGWQSGGGHGTEAGNDERLRRDVPPHW